MNAISFGKGSVEYAKDNLQVSQIVTTSDGKKIVIPNMMGSSTHVRPLNNGSYEVTHQYSVYGSKPETRIMSEEDFVAEYENLGKKLNILM